MKLFEALPQNLFSILASKNKSLYVEALFVLRKAFRQEMSIARSDLVSMLVANLDEAMLNIDMEAEKNEYESGDDDIKEGQGLSSAAYHILRRLRDTGWIEVEYQLDSFEENITLPDYTVKLVNLLYSFTDEAVREYNSYVYSTYSALRTADAERDDFMFNALLTAHENTVRLVDELKTLHNNIRRYHQTLNSYATANEVLKGHFDEYKAMIMDRIYHPLKTLDSVPRFKIPIIKILAGWLSDFELRQRMAKQAVQRGKYRTMDEAMDDIILKMGEISDLYEGMDGMLEEIDRKNAAYTRASIEKMHYLLNTDRSIKGKLVDIITAAVSGAAASAGAATADAVTLSPTSAAGLASNGFAANSATGFTTDASAAYMGTLSPSSAKGPALDAADADAADSDAANTTDAAHSDAANNIDAADAETIRVSASPRPGLTVEMLADSVELYRQGYIDENSLYSRVNKNNGRKDEKPLRVEERDALAGETAMHGFMEKAKKLYGHRKIMAFVERLMAGKDIVNSSEIRLESDEEFILLILAALKGSERNLFYSVEFADEYIDCDGYRIPCMRFIRKGYEMNVG